MATSTALAITHVQASFAASLFRALTSAPPTPPVGISYLGLDHAVSPRPTPLSLDHVFAPPAPCSKPPSTGFSFSPRGTAVLRHADLPLGQIGSWRVVDLRVREGEREPRRALKEDVILSMTAAMAKDVAAFWVLFFLVV